MNFNFEIKEKVRIEKYVKLEGTKTEYNIYELLETLEDLESGESMRIDKDLREYLMSKNLIKYDGVTYSSVTLDYNKEETLTTFINILYNIAYGDED